MSDRLDVEILVDAVIDREGGFVDNPADKGGPTCFGIFGDDASAAGTAAALARAYPDWWIVPTHLDSPAQAEISSRG